jgi:hypothetical protein
MLRETASGHTGSAGRRRRAAYRGRMTAGGDTDDELPVYGTAGQCLPEDARRIGLTRDVPDGALLDFAGSLDPAKPLHRVTAWAMLVVFGLPVVFYVLRLALEVLGWAAGHRP